MECRCGDCVVSLLLLVGETVINCSGNNLRFYHSISISIFIFIMDKDLKFFTFSF